MKKRSIRAMALSIGANDIKQRVAEAQNALKSGDFGKAFCAADDLCKKLAPAVGGSAAAVGGLDCETLRNIYLTALVWRVRAKSGLGGDDAALPFADEYYRQAVAFSCTPRIAQALQIKAQFALRHGDWHAACNALGELLPVLRSAGEVNARIEAAAALSNCLARLCRFSDARNVLIEAEQSLAGAPAEFQDLKHGLIMARYDIEILVGNPDAAQASLDDFGASIDGGAPCRQDDLCVFLIAQANRAAAQFDIEAARMFIDKLKSLPVCAQSCAGQNAEDAKQIILQKTVIGIAECRVLWDSGNYDAARALHNECIKFAPDRASRQTLALLRCEWAVCKGRCPQAHADPNHIPGNGGCGGDCIDCGAGLLPAQETDDPKSVAAETAPLFAAQDGDSDIAMQMYRGFIDAEYSIECGNFENAGQILNKIKQMATFRDCFSAAARARFMLCQAEICKGNARNILDEAIDVCIEMRRRVGAAEALPAFLSACRLCIVHGRLDDLETQCRKNFFDDRNSNAVQTVLNMASDLLGRCFRGNNAAGCAALGLEMLKIHAARRDAQAFGDLAKRLSPYMQPRHRAYDAMAFWRVCERFGYGDPDAGAADAAARETLLSKIHDIAEVNGFYLPNGD